MFRVTQLPLATLKTANERLWAQREAKHKTLPETEEEPAGTGRLPRRKLTLDSFQGGEQAEHSGESAHQETKLPAFLLTSALAIRLANEACVYLPLANHRTKDPECRRCRGRGERNVTAF